MEIQEVEITIGKNGQVEVAVRGVKGLACLDITRDLEQALGSEVVLREMNAESLEANPNLIDHTDQLNTGS